MPVTTLKTNLNEIWDKVLSQIQKRLQTKIYITLFLPI